MKSTVTASPVKGDVKAGVGCQLRMLRHEYHEIRGTWACVEGGGLLNRLGKITHNDSMTPD